MDLAAVLEVEDDEEVVFSDETDSDLDADIKKVE